jgi:alpha-glucosidase
MMRTKARQLLLPFFLLALVPAISQTHSFKSPDNRHELSFSPGNQLTHPLSFRLVSGKQEISSGALVLDIAEQSLRLTRIETSRKSGSWTSPIGERKQVPENYTEQQLAFTCAADPSLRLTVYLRLYNEGFAYRYRLKQAKDILLKDEHSQFGLPADAGSWVSTTAQGVLKETKLREITDIVERPLTVRLKDNLYVALGEAALVDGARMKFRYDKTDGLVTRLEGEMKATGELQSAWRYVLIANSPASLLQHNYLLLNLNEPSAIKDASWIRPGTVLREVTLTTKGAFNAIDFAVRHNMAYILFDAGWYGREDHDTSDASRVNLDPLRSKGPLSLQEVIRYGQSKGVGVILYVNRRALEKQLDVLLPLYQSWGVKGLKFGFVQVGSQKWTSWLHEAIRKCARYHMVVDVHDEYRPTGYSRTYPNLLTQEGIRGDEESPVTEQSITTLFTRMIAGAADNTNCFFTARVDRMGSHAAQMAKAVCIYSPLQFLYWYDHPAFDLNREPAEGDIREVPELAWFDALPASWDDTRVLEGDMRAYATIARKKKNNWFVGSLNGQSPRELVLPLNFLDKGRRYTATIYTHDTTLQTATHIRIRKIAVRRDMVLRLPVAARDGVAISIAAN